MDYRFLSLCLVLVSGPAYAYEFQGTQTMAIGGAGRALTSGNDAINLNPAGLAWVKMYSFEASVRDDLRGSDTWINASIVDSQAGPIAGGISYTYIDRLGDDGEKTQLGHQIDVALATRISPNMSLGATARYLKSDESDADSAYQLFTIDAGYQWRLTQGLSFGLTANNITDTEKSTAPMTFGGGVSYASDSFGMSADMFYNSQSDKPKYLAGLAYLLGINFPVRAGFSYDDADETVFVSGGIGYQTQGLSADLAYRHRVEQGLNTASDAGDRQLAFSLRLTFF